MSAIPSRSLLLALGSAAAILTLALPAEAAVARPGSGPVGSQSKCKTTKITPVPSAPPADPVAAERAARRLALSRRVFVVGDSLTVQAQSHIRNSLRRRVAAVDIDAAISRFTPAGVRLLRSRHATRAQVWVVALGTNDSPDAQRMRSAVRQVMRQARGRKVLWVNVVRPGGYERVNRELSAQARRYCNLDVLDWFGAVRRHRGWLAGDGVHLTEAGSRARGRMTAQHVDALARQP